MNDLKFGDMVTHGSSTVMFIARTDDCPKGHDTPCLIAFSPVSEYDDEPECYVTDGWALTDEGR